MQETNRHEQTSLFLYIVFPGGKFPKQINLLCVFDRNPGYGRGSRSQKVNKGKSCLVFSHKLENGKRYSVDTDMVVCTMSIPYISLRRLKNFKKYLSFLNLTQT